MSDSSVRVYIACSLDGFIAGPKNDLSWLPVLESETSSGVPSSSGNASGGLHYEEFIGDIGSLLMGRSTYDVVRGFDGPWPYGDRPVLVATRRALDADPPPTVRAVRGEIGELVQLAREEAGRRDVYLDGGQLIRQAAEADLIDELTITLAPVAIGEGAPLFAGLRQHYALDIESHHTFGGGMVQLRARPRRPPATEPTR